MQLFNDDPAYRLLLVLDFLEVLFMARVQIHLNLVWTFSENQFWTEKGDNVIDLMLNVDNADNLSQREAGDNDSMCDITDQSNVGVPGYFQGL